MLSFFCLIKLVSKKVVTVLVSVSKIFERYIHANYVQYIRAEKHSLIYSLHFHYYIFAFGKAKKKKDTALQTLCIPSISEIAALC